MLENLRLLFSALWFPATGFLFGSLMVFVLSLGEYGEYLLAAAIAWGIITSIVWAVSLNA
jgi:hypothetical protein